MRSSRVAAELAQHRSRVLAAQRARGVTGALVAVSRSGLATWRTAPEPRVLDLDDALAGRDLRVLERRGDVVDRRARHAGRGEQRRSHSSVVRAPEGARRASAAARRGCASRAAKSAKRASSAARAGRSPRRAAPRTSASRTRRRSSRRRSRSSGTARSTGAPSCAGAAARSRATRPTCRRSMSSCERGLEERDVAVAADAVAARAPDAGEHRDRRRRSRPRGRRARAPLFVGGPSGSPVRLIQPASPCIM